MKPLLMFGLATVGLTCPVGPLDSPAPSIPPVEERPSQTIWIPSDYNFSFNAEPGDTLNLIMNTDDPGAAQEDCDWAGGKLVINHHTDITECWDVDF